MNELENIENEITLLKMKKESIQSNIEKMESEKKEKMQNEEFKNIGVDMDTIFIVYYRKYDGEEIYGYAFTEAGAIRICNYINKWRKDYHRVTYREFNNELLTFRKIEN